MITLRDNMKIINNIINNLNNLYWKAETEFVEKIFNKIIKLDKKFFEKKEIIVKDLIKETDPILFTIDLTSYIVDKINLPKGEIIPSFVSLNNCAGSVELSHNNVYFVKIDICYKNNKDAIAGILAHEISHVWLYKYNLYNYFSELYTNTNDNERLTDLISIFLGMGVLVLNTINLKVEADTDDIIRDLRFKKYKEIKHYLTFEEIGYAMWLFIREKVKNDEELSKLKNYINSNGLFLLNKYENLIKKREKLYCFNKQIGSFIIICKKCFQKLRIPAFKNIIIVKCPICDSEFSVNTNKIENISVNTNKIGNNFFSYIFLLIIFLLIMTLTAILTYYLIKFTIENFLIDF